MKIKSIAAYQVFDSRGSPTVEAVVELDNGTCGYGLVPSGASTGAHEAKELRDGLADRFLGRSVFRAIANVNDIIRPALRDWDVFDQAGLDAALIRLDGTPDKSRLGANALLSVSMATASAAARARHEPLYATLSEGRGTLLPLPEIQIFGGGKHAQGRIDVQDFMIVALAAKSYEETLEVSFNVYHAAGRVMRERGLLAGVADEGGYWPMFKSNDAALGVLLEAIEEAGYVPGRDVGISLDIAATDLYRGGRYHFGLEGLTFTSKEFSDLMVSWLDRFPIVSLEDPLAEDDWDGWQRLNAEIGHRCQLIGDDLFTTHLMRIKQGITLKAANAVLIKLNQIGTVTETLAAIRCTQAAGWRPVISGRSGDTEDTFISHLAVATNAGQLKAGSFCRSERTVKWNEILRIQHQLGSRARFEGAAILRR